MCMYSWRQDCACGHCPWTRILSIILDCRRPCYWQGHVELLRNVDCANIMICCQSVRVPWCEKSSLIVSSTLPILYWPRQLFSKQTTPFSSFKLKYVNPDPRHRSSPGFSTPSLLSDCKAALGGTAQRDFNLSLAAVHVSTCGFHKITETAHTSAASQRIPGIQHYPGTIPRTLTL